MTDETPTWNVLPHDPMARISETVHRVEGALPSAPIRRVMTVVRRTDGSVLVHSPITVDGPTIRAIDALGPVTAIVVPSGMHRLDAPAYAARYPDAKVWAPRGGRTRIAKAVRVDGTLDAFRSDAHLRVEPIAGIRNSEYAFAVTDADGLTLVLNDVVFDTPHLPGFQGFVLKHVTRSSGGPKVTGLFRLAAMQDREALRSSLHHLAALPGLARIVVAHHRMIDHDPAGTLHRVADAL